LQISYRASLSIQKVASEFLTSWWTESVALYGFTTVSDTLGDGTTLKVAIIRFGNSKYAVRTLRDSASKLHHISGINLTLTNLRNQQHAHAGACTATERVGDLEALEGVAAFGLATDYIQYLIN
jgi:hypothetical protein